MLSLTHTHLHPVLVLPHKRTGSAAVIMRITGCVLKLATVSGEASWVDAKLKKVKRHSRQEESEQMLFSSPCSCRYDAFIDSFFPSALLLIRSFCTTYEQNKSKCIALTNALTIVCIYMSVKVPENICLCVSSVFVALLPSLLGTSNTRTQSFCQCVTKNTLHSCQMFLA